jgi:hypothetical protein
MEDDKEQEQKEKEMNVGLLDAYGNDTDEAKHATNTIAQINKDLEAREQHTLVFNGQPYSKSYLYNQIKAINYAPAKGNEVGKQVSMGLVHEKIVAFCAFFLKYIFKRRIKCYDDKGNIVPGMGEIYDLMIEHSYKLEQFKKKIALIYWDVFSQGDAFIYDHWEVKNLPQREAYKEGQKVMPDDMDYTYEYLDSLTYQDAEMIQVRRAVSRILDGRCVILGNPEIEEVQEQPRVTLEEVISSDEADKVYGSLKRFAKVPKDKENINIITGDEKITLFGVERLKDCKKDRMVHVHMDKENNRFNVFLNGVMLLPRNTPFTLFFPRNNYPVSMVHSERLTGSAYSRSTPAKTKFNADFVDWALSKLAEKFEQGVDPALLVKGKYTLTKDLFKGGQRTHGISKGDYEKADPENRGITGDEFNFVSLLKEILESQTLNSTTTGEIADQSTATAVNAAQSNQIEKLGFLLDGIINGFMDMAMRRGETIESKYTMKKDETIVDGKTINVYQNFTVSMGGGEHAVQFDDSVGGETYDVQGKKDELFQKSFNDRKKGQNNHYYLANPDMIRQRKFAFDVEIVPDRRKDAYLQILELREEFAFLMKTFGKMMNIDEMKKEYLTISGRSDRLFLPGDAIRLNEMLNQQDQGQLNQRTNPGNFGRPKVGEAVKVNAKTL